ncbi:MAG: hypothetical protein CVV02_08155 [Firmicutes bacterium HGW-Firmicutes-7]|nr:MAG: hypothetical protein CVV02_08155 [Firmicutes bacterium HGW-Firmicutes-7]
MEKYFRKIVHIEAINKEYCPHVAYYKLEKRNGKYKVTISIEGIQSRDEENYYFCLVYKKDQRYYAKEIQAIIVGKNGKVNQVIQVDEPWMNEIKGVVIRCNQEPILVGYQDEVFNYNNLNTEKIKTEIHNEEKKESIYYNKDKAQRNENLDNKENNKEEVLNEEQNQGIPKDIYIGRKQGIQNSGPADNQNEQCRHSVASNQNEQNSHGLADNLNEQYRHSVASNQNEQNSHGLAGNQNEQYRHSVAGNQNEQNSHGIAGNQNEQNSHGIENNQNEANSHDVLSNQADQESYKASMQGTRNIQDVDTTEEIENDQKTTYPNKGKTNKNNDSSIKNKKLDTNTTDSFKKEKSGESNDYYKQSTINHNNAQSNKNQSSKKPEGALNTIDYIKKQLELKEEVKKIEDIFQQNDKITPFDKQDPKTEWVKIEITDLVFLPLESWILMNNAFLMTCYRKYKHLILGRNKDEGTLKLGIPDIYYFKESLIANVCGFDEFYPCNGKNPKSGEYGYWVIRTIL